MGCGGFTCSKNALAALNVLYILVALILITVAAYGKAMAVITSISITSGIIACGVFLLLIAFVGLIGAIKHHQVLLFFYMIILFLIFLVQFSVACACIAVNSVQQETIARQGWMKATPDIKSQVQVLANCCGFNKATIGLTDLSADPMAHPLCGEPDGDIHGDKLQCCANNHDAPCCVGGGGNITGVTGVGGNRTGGEGGEGGDYCPCDPCWDDFLTKHIDDALKISGGIGLFFSFTEIFGVWITVRYRNQKDPRANPSAFL